MLKSVFQIFLDNIQQTFSHMYISLEIFQPSKRMIFNAMQFPKYKDLQIQKWIALRIFYNEIMTMTRRTCMPDVRSPCKVYVTQSRIYLDFLLHQVHKERCHPHGNVYVDYCTVPVELPERHSAGRPRRRCFAAHCSRWYRAMPWC